MATTRGKNCKFCRAPVGETADPCCAATQNKEDYDGSDRSSKDSLPSYASR